MRQFLFCLASSAALWLVQPASAGYDFYTNSMATQTITSPVFGNNPISITGSGLQHYVIDPATGSASVTSDFKGTDLPNPFEPGSFFSYHEYNTTTTGVVTPTGSGTYTITFTLLFELDITSGPLAGLELDTHSSAIFQATNIAAIPLLAGTAFGDPSRPNDPVTIFVKHDPTGTFADSSMFGVSTDRLVTVNGVVPEPSSLILCALGAGIVAFASRARGRKPSTATE